MLFAFVVSLLGLFFLFVNTIRFFRTQKDKGFLYKVLSVYLCFLFIEELCCNVLGFLEPGSNFFLSHYYFILQFVILSFFYNSLFPNRFLRSIIKVALVLVLLILAVQYYQTPEIYWRFNLLEVGLTSIPLIVYALLFLILNFKKVKHKYFYFSNGLLLYLSCSACIFLTGNTESVFFTEPFILDFWFFNSLFYILYQFLIYKEWKFLNSELTLEEEEELTDDVSVIE